MQDTNISHREEMQHKQRKQTFLTDKSKIIPSLEIVEL